MKKKKINYIKDPQRLIREKLFFDYTDFIKENLNFINNWMNLTMLDWFIGFVEAQSYNCWVCDIKANRQSFFLNYNDISILFKIKKLLGFGKVKIYYENGVIKYFKYIVNTNRGTYLLLLLFNGNLLLKKSQKNFKYYFDLCCKKFFINLKFKVGYVNINIKLNNNGWLSGFCDERCIFFFNKKKNKLQIFLLILNKNEYNILSLFMLFKLNINKSLCSIFLIKNKITQLINYFLKYPLRTKKNLDFVRFKKLNFRLNNNLIVYNFCKKSRAQIRFEKLIKNLNKNFYNKKDN